MSGNSDLTAKPSGRSVVCMVVFRDGLNLASGTFVPSPQQCRVFLRLDEDCTHDGELQPAVFAELCAQMYGPHWQSGNEDGSCYAVGEFKSGLYNDDECANQPWLKVKDTPTLRYWFYHRLGPNQFVNVAREAF